MTKTFTACLLLVGLLLAQRVAGQSPPGATQPGATATPAPSVADPLGRDSPHGTITGLIGAAEQGNLDRAAEYLDSGLKPAARRELARQLWTVLDRKLRTSLDRLSKQPDGDLNDGLPTRDRVGVVDSESGDVEIVLDRVQRGQGSRIWLFPASVLREIPRLADEVEPPWIEGHVPERLRSTRWLSLPLYSWIAILVFIPLIFALAALCTRLVAAWLGPRLSSHVREHGDRALGSSGPLRLLLLGLFFYGASFLGITLATRHFWNRVAQTLTVMALCWLALRAQDIATELSLKRLERVHRSADTALVRLLNRLLKAATVMVTALMLLYLADVDLTAAVTGLGVGGLAIGFGAQKTIENLFGGIMVISDKPVNVGDFCKAGEFVGTVEDIGIRSTRIRTLDRTVVAVPNGLLAAMSLENFSLRDRTRFQHTVAITRLATTGQLRDVLTDIRRLLAAHPRVDATSARARFIRLSATAVEIEIFAYVLEHDQPTFLVIQEELLLGIKDIVDSDELPLPVPVPAPPVATGPGLRP